MGPTINTWYGNLNPYCKLPSYGRQNYLLQVPIMVYVRGLNHETTPLSASILIYSGTLSYTTQITRNTGLCCTEVALGCRAKPCKNQTL